MGRDICSAKPSPRHACRKCWRHARKAARHDRKLRDGSSGTRFTIAAAWVWRRLTNTPWMRSILTAGNKRPWPAPVKTWPILPKIDRSFLHRQRLGSRSEERRGGEAGTSTWNYRCAASHEKKKKRL